MAAKMRIGQLTCQGNFVPSLASQVCSCCTEAPARVPTMRALLEGNLQDQPKYHTVYAGALATTVPGCKADWLTISRKGITFLKADLAAYHDGTFGPIAIQRTD